jgi:1-acyl-sn-glycerol-3-phosphate acyltransferase
MIYRTTHNFFVYNFFQVYSIWKTKRNFHKVYVNGNFDDRGLPVLVISNHFSWWDGFWVVCLNYKRFHRVFNFMMLEEELKKRMFFTKTGGFSIKKGSKSVIETIEYTAELLSDKKYMVLLFPQGEMKSMHIRDIKFEKGIEYIIRKIPNKIHLIFLVNLIDYFSSRKPGLYMYFREYTGVDFSTETLEKEFNLFYSECMAENLKMTGV